MITGRLWSQVVAAVVMSMTTAINGIGISFAALLIAESQSDDDDAQLSIKDATLVASMFHLGRVAGSLVSAQLTDRLGVLRVIQLSTPLNMIAWPLLAFGERDIMLAGAILVGTVVGLTTSTCRLYIAEVTSSQTRVLCYLPGVTTAISLLVNFSLSDVMPWRYATLMCGAATSVVHIAGTLFLPNSPRWMANREASVEEVRKCITFYRGRKADINAEMRGIQRALKGRPNLSRLQQVRLIFTEWSVGKPCLLVAIQFFFESFCGGIVLIQYAISIFQESVKSLNKTQSSQLLAALQIGGQVATACLLHKLNRTTVLISASFITCCGLFTASVFYYYESDLEDETWILMVAIIVANTACQSGISPMSHLCCGELLPLSVRQMFANITSLLKGVLTMLFTYLFPLMRDRMGASGLFATLAGINVLQMIFARVALPETRGLTLEEVQRRYFPSMRMKRALANQSSTLSHRSYMAAAPYTPTAGAAQAHGAGEQGQADTGQPQATAWVAREQGSLRRPTRRSDRKQRSAAGGDEGTGELTAAYTVEPQDMETGVVVVTRERGSLRRPTRRSYRKQRSTGGGDEGTGAQATADTEERRETGAGEVVAREQDSSRRPTRRSYRKQRSTGGDEEGTGEQATTDTEERRETGAGEASISGQENTGGGEERTGKQATADTAERHETGAGKVVTREQESTEKGEGEGAGGNDGSGERTREHGR